MEPKRWKAYPKYFPYKLKGRYKKVFPDVTEETKINLLPLNINQDKQSKYNVPKLLSYWPQSAALIFPSSHWHSKPSEQIMQRLCLANHQIYQHQQQYPIIKKEYPISILMKYVFMACSLCVWNVYLCICMQTKY